MPARIRPLTFQQDFMPGRTLNLFRPFYAVDRFGAAESSSRVRPGLAPALPVGKAGQRGGPRPVPVPFKSRQGSPKNFFPKVGKIGSDLPPAVL